MKKEIKELIIKGNVRLYNSENLQANAGELTPEEIGILKNNKLKILEYLKQKEIDEAKRRIEEEEKRIAKYDNLKKQLPAIPEYKNIPDEEKFRALTQKAQSLKYYGGTEDDGLDIAISAEKERIMKEARQYCQHEIQIEYNYTHTYDARKLIERTIECEKCGLYRKDTVSEKLSSEAIWR